MLFYVVGEIISSGLGVVGFSWVRSMIRHHFVVRMESSYLNFRFFSFRFVAQHVLNLKLSLWIGWESF